MTRPPSMSTRAKAAAAAFAPAGLAGELDVAKAAAARAWSVPALAAAPVVWLRDHAVEMAPPDAADVADLRTFLLALEGEGPVAADAPGATPAEEPGSALDAPLCALCRGRCCRQGLQGNAFLEPRDLRGWLAQQPGASWADAVDHYLGFVAPEHLQASCLFHGTQGCTLPRERRSAVCNQFACATLEQLHDLAGPSAEALVVVGIVGGHETRGAAMLSPAGSRWLPGLSERE